VEIERGGERLGEREENSKPSFIFRKHFNFIKIREASEDKVEDGKTLRLNTSFALGLPQGRMGRGRVE